MTNGDKNKGFKMFKVNAINEIIEKMNDVVTKNNNESNSSSVKNKKKISRRYTNSDIFNNVKPKKELRAVDIKAKRRYTDSKIFDSQGSKINSKREVSTSVVKTVSKQSTSEAKQTVSKNKKQSKVMDRWNSFDVEIENINSTINKLNGELKEIGKKKRNVVNDLKTVIDGESNKLDIKKREVVLKSWDTLEKEENSINKRIIDLKKELKNIYQNKNEILDELKRMVDLKITELDLEIIGSKKNKKKKVMKRRISKKALDIKKNLKDSGLL